MKRYILDISVDKRGIPKPSNRITYPLHMSSLIGDMEVLQKYVALRVDIDCRDKQGRTSLHEACCSRNREVALEIIKFLVRNRADVRAADRFGDTPLHCLARHKRNRLAASFLVLDCKAPLSRLNCFGQTPLDVAKEACYSFLKTLDIDPKKLTSNNEHFDGLPEVLQFLLLHECANHLSLRELAKERILCQLNTYENDKLHQLPLPNPLKCYVGGDAYIEWIKQQEERGELSLDVLEVEGVATRAESNYCNIM